MTREELEARKLEAEVASLEAQAGRDKAQQAAALANARHQDAQADRAEAENRISRHKSLDSGDFLFAGGVDQDGVEAYMTHLTLFHDLHPGDDITFRINSSGGSIIQGFALFDLLVELGRDHHVTTVAYGMVASMGGILFQAGAARLVAPHAHMLIHEGSLSFQGAAGAVADTVAFGKTLQGQCLDILARRSLLGREEIARRWERRDWWLTAEDMIEHGFADGIRS